MRCRRATAIDVCCDPAPVDGTVSSLLKSTFADLMVGPQGFTFSVELLA
jgi:hypothetical protein